jgi:hypothetical protein
MTVRLVTFRYGGKQEEVVAATTRLKTWWASHGGAAGTNLSRVIAGSDADHWVTVIWWNDWEAYGRGMAAAMGDAEFLSILAALGEISEVTDRRLLSTIDI